MKKIVIIILLFTNVAFSHITNFYEYLDLRIGNIFVYNCGNSEECGWGAFRVRIIITDTLNYSGKKYYHYTREVVRISGGCPFSSFMFPFYVGEYNTIRLDTLYGTIYYYNPGNGCYYSPNETMIDSLGSHLGDLVTIRCVQVPYSYTCIDTTNKKKFYTGQSQHGEIRREYRRGIGLLDNYRRRVGPSVLTEQQILVGSVINGVVFGDTSFPLVGNSEQLNKFPYKYHLYQNYPNPFNPVTIINYELPITNYVKLSVYDILGREIAVLVNEKLQPGTYEVEWNAGDSPSGVYFYKLTAEEFSETKKLILLK